MSTIARVAESCFWMCRYMERVESTARILGVNRSLVMTAPLAPQNRWRPMLIVVGEEPSFVDEHGQEAADNGELVQRHLTWQRACPVSIATSLYWARENARTIRETISQEIWRSLNGTWLWLQGDEAKALFENQRHAFYAEVFDRCQHFQGVLHGTMLRQQPYDFMRLGLYLERAGQTARLLDVHQHQRLGAAGQGGQQGMGGVDSGEDPIFWSAVLRSCSGYDMFLKTSRRPRLCGPDVFRFLVARRDFPRASLYCLVRARSLLQGLQPPQRPQIGQQSRALSRTLVDGVEAMDTAEALSNAHRHLTWIVDQTAGLCNTIGQEYFHLRELPSAQTQTTTEHPA